MTPEATDVQSPHVNDAQHAISHFFSLHWRDPQSTLQMQTSLIDEKLKKKKAPEASFSSEKTDLHSMITLQTARLQ